MGSGVTDFAFLLKIWVFFQVTCVWRAGEIMFPRQPGARQARVCS